MPRPVPAGTMFDFSGEVITLRFDNTGDLASVEVTGVMEKEGFRSRESITFHVDPNTEEGQRALPLTAGQTTTLRAFVLALRRAWERAT